MRCDGRSSAVLPLVAMIVAVGNARALGEAIDPTLGKESPAMLVDGRVLDNTLPAIHFFLVGLPGAVGVAAAAAAEHHRGAGDRLRD